MAEISISGKLLTVDLVGFNKLWALKSQITVPLAHVRGATVDPGIVAEPKGWRGPGLRTPNAAVGTVHPDGERVFWDVHDATKAIVIELIDEAYARLILQVEDPWGTVNAINEAIPAA